MKKYDSDNTKKALASDYLHWIQVDDTDYAPCVKMTNSPFDNCQTFSISNMATILSSEKRIKSFIEYSKKYLKNQVIFDVYDTFIPIVEKYFDNILLKAKYTNGTGSKMVIFIIKLQ